MALSMIQSGDGPLVKYYAKTVFKGTVLDFQNYFDVDAAAVFSATNPRVNVLVVEGYLILHTVSLPFISPQ